MVAATRLRPPLRAALVAALAVSLGAAGARLAAPRCGAPGRAPAVAPAASRVATVAVHVALAPGAQSHARLARLAAAFVDGAEGARAAAAVEVEPLIASLDAGALGADPTLAGLQRWARVELPLSRDVAARFAAFVVARGVATDAFVEPVIALPVAIAPGAEVAAPPAPPAPGDGDACPIHTPRYDERQGYLAPAPGGVDAAAAWRHPGGAGDGVWFADVEGGWNLGHEDLAGVDHVHVAGRPIDDPSWQAHGTAVLGEVVGRDNGLGVTGLTPAVERVVTASIWRTSVADAIFAAQRALRPGDVLLIELQGEGPRRRWLPVEYWNDAFEVIQHATSRGVIVIEAAGNGGEDLDHRAYGGAFDRARRDSGAILVGAGAPPRPGFTDRARLDFSNHGGRVDVQGWGRRVATLDYGDLQACADGRGPARTRHYTDEFSGTSSASPIVAGAAIALQGVRRAAGLAPLTPAAMRSLLVETGTPQVDGPHGRATQHIGPRPDLARAVPAALAAP